MTKIALTGITGDVGGSFFRSLSTEDTVKVLVRHGSSIPQEKDAKIYPFNNDLIYSSAALEEFTESDILVHCAALLDSDHYTTAETLAVNAMLTGALAMAALRTDTKVIYISTEMVYQLSITQELVALSHSFISFCKENFIRDAKSYDLRALAETFIHQNTDFPFAQYNTYALAKYLGEAIIESTATAAIVRITNAYGPDFTKPRLIPRLIQGRLTGHETTYPSEKRDFVYSEDINRLIDYIITHRETGIIDCRSGELTDVNKLAKMIIHLTPTAYGELTKKEAPEKEYSEAHLPFGRLSLADITKPTLFDTGLAATVRWHKEQTYHQMKDIRTLQDFLRPGESIFKMLKGSSAAHLCVVVDGENNYRVRKIAIYDGVEGNGIAKVAKETEYYEYIFEHMPDLASLYPRLLDATAGETFSSETIEYLPGKNFYESMKVGEFPAPIYRESLINFISTLSKHATKDRAPIANPDEALDAYYIERSLSRLNPIKNLVTIQDNVVINSNKYLAPHIILKELLQNKQLRSFIKPHIESFCFHGDLTLLNTVFIHDTQEIKLIDPRGHIGKWDPLYDYGKLQFTLAGFGEFVVSTEPMVSQAKNGTFTINFEQIPQVSRELDSDFLEILANDEAFKSNIIPNEPYWRQRIMFAKATHFLADIPFRLFTDDTTATALASYVIGTYYLNEAYEALLHELPS